MEMHGKHCTPAILTPGKETLVPTEQMVAAWTPYLAWNMSVEEKPLLNLPGIELRFLGCAAHTLSQYELYDGSPPLIYI
jgi:hypothetical protein